MVQSSVKKLIERIEQIPSLPLVIQEIIKRLENPEVTPQEINTLIQQDLALLTKVLKLVNSAFYGFSGQISTVTQAIIILGFNTIKNIALSTVAFDRFRSLHGFSAADFDLVTFWNHSIAVGVCSRMITQKLRLQDESEEVFIAGILHDIGKIIMIEYQPRTYQQVLAGIRQENLLYYEAEETAFGFDHAQVGTMLMKHWKLPASLETALQYHHKPDAAPQSGIYPSIIHIADIIVYSQKIGLPHARIPQLSEFAWKLTGLTKPDIAYIVEHLGEELKKAELFHLLTKSG